MPGNNGHRRWKLFCLGTVIVGQFLSTVANAEEWVRGAFRVLTDVSAGKNGFFDIADIASEKDLDFVVFTDQFIVRGEYGVPPLRRALKYVQERPSISTYGVKRYLDGIASAQSSFPNVILIPGADVAPIYEWTGSPFDPPLLGHRWSEQITVLGSWDPKFYENLPAIHNDPLGFKFPDTLLRLSPLIIIVFGGLLIAQGITRYYDRQDKAYVIYEKPKIILGSVVAVISLIALIIYPPFKVTRYNQYRDNGLTPFQDLIDYVHENGGISFWSHPEMQMQVDYGPFLLNKFGHVRLQTRPYINDAAWTFRHNGLAGLYGDAIKAYLPGNVWDEMLAEYCRGQREVRPVIVGEIDYHMDRPLDLILTVAQVPEKTEAAILTALRDGNSYAVAGGNIKDLILSEIYLYEDIPNTSGLSEKLAQFVPESAHSVRGSDRLQSSKQAKLGETLGCTGTEATLKIAGEWQGHEGAQQMPDTKLHIVVGGKLVKTVEISESPFDIREQIALNDSAAQYVRFYIKMGGSTLLSNPIFVKKDM